MTAATHERSRLLALARATHLEPTIAVTAITCALAWGAGVRGERLWLVAAAVLAGQASVGWSNDWLDRERDRAAARADKPIAAGQLQGDAVLTGAVVALIAVVPLSFAVGLAPGLVHLAAVASAWTYNLRLKLTVLSPLPFAVSFGLLPVFATLAARLGPPPWWTVSAAALLGAGAHLTQSLPDLEADQEVGVRALPHRLGPMGCLVAASVLLDAAAAIILLSSAGWESPFILVPLVAAFTATGGVMAAGLAGRRRLAFRLTIVMALLVVAALLGGAWVGALVDVPLR